MKRAVVVLLAGACGFQGASSTTTGDGAPVIDAPPDTNDAAVDAAIDVMIDADLCGSFDEDGDGVRDACDKCPQVANESIVDSDGDGVVNDCDPHASLPDMAVAFEGFNGAALPAGWQEFGPDTFTFEGGDLVVTSDDTRNIVRIETGSASHTIEVAYTVNAVGPASTHTVAALADLDATLDSFYLCGTRFDQQERELWRFHVGDSAEPLHRDPEALGIPGSYRVRLSSGPMAPACSVTIPPSNTIQLASTMAPSGQTAVGLRSRNVAVRFHWVAIYKH